MRTMLIAAAAAALVAVGCDKDDKKKDDAPASNNPGLASIAPNFKNTAKDGKEVATRVDGVRTDLSKSSLSLVDAKPSHGGTTHLSLAKVSTFLRGGTLKAPSMLSSAPSFPTPPSDGDESMGPSATAPGGDVNPLNLQEDSSCDAFAQELADAYQQTLDGLKTSADELRQWDDQQLPDGVTRTTADGRFAVGYQIDVAKVIASQGSQEPSSITPTPGEGEITTPPLSDVTGAIVFGAGASDHEVGLELDANLAAKSDGANGALKTGFAVYADQTARQIKVSANLDLAASGKDEDGNAGSANAKASFQSTLDAGAQPSLAVFASASYAATSGAQTEQGSVSATMSLKKVAADQLVFESSVTDDEGTKTEKIELVTDAHGNCVVKSAAK
jgi:hypothetical protein